MAGNDAVLQRSGADSLSRAYQGLRLLVQARLDQLLVVAVAICAHGWLILNNGIYWDDWLLYSQLTRGDVRSVQGMADQLGGIPTYLYIWIVAAALPPPAIGFKVLAFVLIAVSGLLLLAICKRSSLVGRTNALWITCLAVAYPSDHTHVLLITVPYLVYWVAFLLGVLLLIRSESAGRARWYWRAPALVCFLFSFGLNSLLVFYYGALLIGAFHLLQQRAIGLKGLVTTQLVRRLDLILAPVVFWVTYRVFFPPNGIYSYYHQFVWTPEWLWTAVTAFWQSGVAAQFRDSLMALAGTLGWLIALLVILRFWPLGEGNPMTRYTRLAMLLLGITLLLLACFPYIIVGLYPTERGWSSRHTILLGVPIALILVSGIGLLFSTKDRRMTILGASVLATLLLGFVLDTAEGYLSWQARWIKDSSVIANLAASPGGERYSVYWITDSFPSGGEPEYRFYEWSAILSRAYGDQSRIGLDASTTPPSFLETSTEFFNSSYGLANLDPTGCAARVSISRGPRASSDLEMTLRYWYYSVTDPAKRDRWLAGVTKVTIQADGSQTAASCKAPGSG